MRRNRGRKIITITVIMILISIIAALSISIIGTRTKENTIKKAAELNYDITYEDDNCFYILEDGVEYYYESKLGKVVLREIYTEVSVKSGCEVVGNKGKLTVTVKGKDKIEVVLEDTIKYEGYQGEERYFDERIGFVCSSEFTEDSIDPTDGASILGKAGKYYLIITRDFISAEELRDLYDRGETIAQELMGK